MQRHHYHIKIISKNRRAKKTNIEKYSISLLGHQKCHEIGKKLRKQLSREAKVPATELDKAGCSESIATLLHSLIKRKSNFPNI
jgi:hypothetical protein